jgi:hypothetical protein
MTKIEIGLPAQLETQIAEMREALSRIEARMDSADEWLTTKQAADVLKCSVETVRKRVKDGHLPAHRPV